MSAKEEPELFILWRLNYGNQFRQGVDIFVGATGNELCPVAALLAYLALRGSRYGPVFVNQTGLPLTKGSFVENLRAALKGLG